MNPTGVDGNAASANDCPEGTGQAVQFPNLSGFTGTTSLPYSFMGHTGTISITVSDAAHAAFTITGAAVAFQVRLHGGAGSGGANATNIYTYTSFPAGGVTSDSNLHFPGPSSNMLFCLRASTILAVTTSSVKATRSGKLVTLRWRTASEHNTLGFRVYRKVANGKLAQLTKRMIPAANLAQSAASHAYSFRARLASAKLAASSRYVLAEIHLDGSRQLYGPVRAVAAT